MNYKQIFLDGLYNVYKLTINTKLKTPKNETIGILFFSNPNRNIPLGEFILREPFFRYLCANKNKLVLISDDPFGDDLIKIAPFSKYFSERIEKKQIADNSFDTILNLQNYPFKVADYKILKNQTKRIYSIGDKSIILNPQLWKYIDYFPKPMIGSRHELQRAFDILNVTCNFNNSKFVPKINYNKRKEKYDYAINLLDINSMKSWNTERLIEFIKKNKSKKIILIGDKNAKNQEKQILDQIKVKSEVGKQNINKLIDTISISKNVITPDTGTAHLGTAMGKKVIAGYGPTELDRWKPLGKNVIQLYNKQGCRDCRETRICKIKTKECMNIKLVNI